MASERDDKKPPPLELDAVDIERIVDDVLRATPKPVDAERRATFVERAKRYARGSSSEKKKSE